MTRYEENIRELWAKNHRPLAIHFFLLCRKLHRWKDTDFHFVSFEINNYIKLCCIILYIILFELIMYKSVIPNHVSYVHISACYTSPWQKMNNPSISFNAWDFFKSLENPPSSKQTSKKHFSWNPSGLQGFTNPTFHILKCLGGWLDPSPWTNSPPKARMVDPFLGYRLPPHGRRLPNRHPTSGGLYLNRGLEAGARGEIFRWLGCFSWGGLMVFVGRWGEVGGWMWVCLFWFVPLFLVQSFCWCFWWKRAHTHTHVLDSIVVALWIWREKRHVWFSLKSLLYRYFWVGNAHWHDQNLPMANPGCNTEKGHCGDATRGLDVWET